MLQSFSYFLKNAVFLYMFFELWFSFKIFIYILISSTIFLKENTFHSRFHLIYLTGSLLGHFQPKLRFWCRSSAKFCLMILHQIFFLLTESPMTEMVVSASAHWDRMCSSCLKKFSLYKIMVKHVIFYLTFFN